MSSLAIATVCLERVFSVIHIILIMGANRYLRILVKLYPVPSIVLEVSGPVSYINFTKICPKRVVNMW